MTISEKKCHQRRATTRTKLWRCKSRNWTQNEKNTWDVVHLSLYKIKQLGFVGCCVCVFFLVSQYVNPFAIQWLSPRYIYVYRQIEREEKRKKKTQMNRKQLTALYHIGMFPKVSAVCIEHTCLRSLWMNPENFMWFCEQQQQNTHKHT